MEYCPRKVHHQFRDALFLETPGREYTYTELQHQFRDALFLGTLTQEYTVMDASLSIRGCTITEHMGSIGKRGAEYFWVVTALISDPLQTSLNVQL